MLPSMSSSRSLYINIRGRKEKNFYFSEVSSMGACFSDAAGGQEAVGGSGMHADKYKSQAFANETTRMAHEAVEFLMKTKGVQGLSTLIELSLSASKLRDRDVLSKSDPMAVVYMRKQDGSLEELGRTEVILNSLDPVWITKLRITYYFEILQRLLFRLYDVDTKFNNVPVQMGNSATRNYYYHMAASFLEIH